MELNEPELQMPEPKIEIKVAFVLTFFAYFVYFSLYAELLLFDFCFAIFIGFCFCCFMHKSSLETNSCVTAPTAAMRGSI